jgi:hypothetical protein
MADESEETRKMVEKLDKRDKDLVRLRQANEEVVAKVAAQDKAIEKTEEEKKKAEKKAEKLEKMVMIGGERANRLASDGVGSMAAQAINVGEQVLLDYLIKTFSKTVGPHQVMVKALPPVLALLWYLAEMVTMKGPPSLPKQMRLTAANMLSNLNFVYMAQAFWRDQEQRQAESIKVGQTLEARTASEQELSSELEKAKKLLKDRGIELESADNG